MKPRPVGETPASSTKPVFEPLEPRILLSADVSLIDPTGPNADVASLDKGDAYHVEVAESGEVDVSGHDGSTLAEADLGALAGDERGVLAFTGTAGTESVTVAFEGDPGNLPAPLKVTFDGKEGQDSLRIEGGPFDRADARLGDELSSTVNLSADGTEHTLEADGIETVEDLTAAAERTVGDSGDTASHVLTVNRAEQFPATDADYATSSYQRFADDTLSGPAYTFDHSNTNETEVEGSSADDALSVVFDLDPRTQAEAPNLSFVGAGGRDSLEISEATFAKASHVLDGGGGHEIDYTHANLAEDGTVTSEIDAESVELVTDRTLSVARAYTTGAGPQSLRLADADPDADDGVHKLSSTTSALPEVLFTAPTGSASYDPDNDDKASVTSGTLTIDLGAGDDTMMFEGLEPGITANVTFKGGPGTNTLEGPASGSDASDPDSVFWRIDSTDAGRVAGHAFTSFGTLQGAADNADTFAFDTDALPGFDPDIELTGQGVLGGAGGADRIVLAGKLFGGTDGADQTSGTLDVGGVKADYAGIEPSITVGGTPFRDDIDLSADGNALQVTVDIFKSSGADDPDETLTYGTDVSTAIAALTVNMGFGADTFTLADSLQIDGTLTVRGDGQSDTIKLAEGAELNTAGNAVAFTAEKIKLGAGAKLSTRNLDGSGNVVGSAGDITLEGTTIDLADGADIRASATPDDPDDGFDGGAVEIRARDRYDLAAVGAELLGGIRLADAKVELGDGRIEGRSVTVDADANARQVSRVNIDVDALFRLPDDQGDSDGDGQVDRGAVPLLVNGVQMTANAAETLLTTAADNLKTAVDIIQQVQSNFQLPENVKVLVSRGTADVDLKGTQVAATGDLDLDAVAKGGGSIAAQGSVLGFAYAGSVTSAQLDVADAAALEAGGALSIKANANNQVDATTEIGVESQGAASTATKQLRQFDQAAAAFTVVRGKTVARADAGQAAELEGTKVDVDASATGKYAATTATNATPAQARGGKVQPIAAAIGVTLGVYEVDADAKAGGTVSASDGAVTVDAQATQSSSGVETAAVVSKIEKSGSNSGSITNKAKNFVKSFKGKKGAKTSLAGGIAGAITRNEATAKIASDAVVDAGTEKVEVDADAIQNFATSALGASVNASQKLAVAGAVAVANVDNDATAEIAEGASVTGGAVDVTADAKIPLPINVTSGLETLRSLDGFEAPPDPGAGREPLRDIAEWADKDVIDEIRTAVNALNKVVAPFLGTSAIATGYTSASASTQGTSGGGKSFSVAGSVDVRVLNNDANAVVADDVDIGKSGNRVDSLTVDATSSVKTINLTGLPPDVTSGVRAIFSELSTAKNGGGSFGGNAVIETRDTGAFARVGDDVDVHSVNNVDVTADSTNFIVAVGMSGGFGQDVNLNGALAIQAFTNATKATVEDSADIDIQDGSLTVDATSDLEAYAFGGSLSVGGKAGLGGAAVSTGYGNMTVAAIADTDDSGSGGGEIDVAGAVDVQATSEELLLDLSVAGGATSSGVGGSGSSGASGVAGAGGASVNTLDDATKAYIASDADVPEADRLSVNAGGDIKVDAETTGLAMAISGALAVQAQPKGGAAFAGSFTTNVLTRTTKAYTRYVALTTDGSVHVGAKTKDISVSTVVGIGVAASPNKGAAVTGSANTTDVTATTQARLGAHTVVDARNDVIVEATHDPLIVDVAGQGGFGGQAAAGGAAEVVLFNSDTLAEVGQDAVVDAGGLVGVYADASPIVVSVAGAGNVSGKGTAASASTSNILFGVGSVGSLAELDDTSRPQTKGELFETDPVTNTVKARVGDSATVTADESVVVDARDTTTTVTLAGALAVGGGQAGAGGSLATTVVVRDVNAEIAADADVTAYGEESDYDERKHETRGVVVDANATDRNFLFAVTAAGGKSAGVAGSLTTSVYVVNTTARIERGAQINQRDTDSFVDAQSVAVRAAHNTATVGLAGGVAVGQKAALSGALGLNVVLRDTVAGIGDRSTDVGSGDAAVSAEDDVVVAAQSDDWSLLLEANVAGSDKVGVAGSIGVGVFVTETRADVDDAQVDARDSVAVQARGDALIGAVAGSAGIAASTGAGIGLSSTVTVHVDTVTAEIGGGARVTALGRGDGVTVATGGLDDDNERAQRTLHGVAVSAVSAEFVAGVDVAGGGSAGGVGVAGSAAVNVLNETTQARVRADATIRQGADAADSQELSVLAWDETALLGVGAGVGIGGGTAGVGAGMDVAVVDKTTQAYLGPDASVDVAGHVRVDALANETVRSLSAAAGGGQYAGVAGSVGVITVLGDTDAYIGTGATVTAGGSVAVQAESATDADFLTGTVSISVYASVGASSGIVVLDKSTEAYVADDATVDGAGRRGGLTVYTGEFGIGFNDDSQSDDGSGDTSEEENQAPSQDDSAVGADIGLGAVRTGFFLVNGEKLETDVTDDQALSDARAASPNTRTIHGVGVSAVTDDNVKGAVVSAGGALVGVNVGANVAVSNVTTKAYVGDAEINRTVADPGDEQEVLVAAGSDYHRLGFTAIAGVGGGGFGGSLSVDVGTTTTKAYLSEGASVAAADDVTLRADSTVDMLAIAVGAGVGGAGVAGTATVTYIDQTTAAYVGADAEVAVEGDVAVLANAASDVDAIGTAIALGGTAVGGTFGFVGIDKSTSAYVASGATVTAMGDGAGISALDDGQAQAPFDTQSIDGVVVQAEATESSLIGILSGSVGSGGGSLAGAVSVHLIDGATKAYIGKDATVDSEGSVMVTAANAVDTTSATGALSGGFTSGLGAAVDIGILRNTTRAGIRAGADVDAKDDVGVTALSRHEIDSFTNAAGVSTGISFGGAFSLYAVGDNLVGTANDQITESRERDEQSDTDIGSQADEVFGADNAGSALGNIGGDSGSGEDNTGDNPSELQDESRTASTKTDNAGRDEALSGALDTSGIEESTHARSAGDVTAGGEVAVTARDYTALQMETGAAAGGAASVGGSALLVRADRDAKAEIAGGTVDAGGDVDVGAKVRLTTDNPDTELDKALSVAGSAGLATLGAAVVVLEDDSDVAAVVSGGADIAAAQSVEVDAEADRDVKLVTGQASVGGIAVGAAVAHADVTGRTTAKVADATIGDPADTPKVARVDLSATANADVDTEAFAVSAGVSPPPYAFAGAGTSAKSLVSGTVAATVRDADIYAGGAVDVTADHTTDLDATTDSFSISTSASVGVSFAEAATTSTVAAKVVGGSTLSARSATVKAGRTSANDATATAASGALLGSGAGAETTATAGGSLTAEIGDADLTAGGVDVRALGNDTANADSTGVSAAAGVAVGVATASATAEPDVTAAVADGASVDAGPVTVKAKETARTDAVGKSAAGALGGSGAGAEVTAKAIGDVDAKIAGGADVTADGAAKVLAVSDADADVRSFGASVAGGVTVGVALGTAKVSPTVDAEIADSSLEAGSITVRATGRQNADADGTAAAGSLVGSGAGVNVTAVTDTDTEVTVRGATLDADGALTLAAVGETKADAFGEGISVAGGIGVGVSRAIAKDTGSTKLDVNGASDLDAGTAALAARHNVAADGSTLSDYGTTAEAVASAGGVLAGVAGADADADSKATVEASLAGSSAVDAGSLDVAAYGAHDAWTTAEGLSVAGFVSVGAVQSTAKVQGRTSAEIAGTATVDVSGGADVVADDDSLADADATTLGGGLVTTTAVNKAKAENARDTSADLSGASVAGDDVRVRADGTARTDANVAGKKISAIDVGGFPAAGDDVDDSGAGASEAEALNTAGSDVSVGDGTRVDAAGAITVAATFNGGGEGSGPLAASADAESASGSLISVDLGSSVIADVDSRVSATATIGDDAVLTAGTGIDVSGDALNQTYADVGYDAEGAIVTAGAELDTDRTTTTAAEVGNRASLTADSGDIDVTADSATRGELTGSGGAGRNLKKFIEDLDVDSLLNLELPSLAAAGAITADSDVTTRADARVGDDAVLTAAAGTLTVKADNYVLLDLDTEVATNAVGGAGAVNAMLVDIAGGKADSAGGSDVSVGAGAELLAEHVKLIVKNRFGVNADATATAAVDGVLVFAGAQTDVDVGADGDPVEADLTVGQDALITGTDKITIIARGKTIDSRGGDDADPLLSRPNAKADKGLSATADAAANGSVFTRADVHIADGSRLVITDNDAAVDVDLDAKSAMDMDRAPKADATNYVTKVVKIVEEVVKKVVKHLPWPLNEIVKWVTETIVRFVEVTNVVESDNTSTSGVDDAIGSDEGKDDEVTLNGTILMGKSPERSLTVDEDGTTRGDIGIKEKTDDKIVLENIENEAQGTVDARAERGLMTGDAVILTPKILSKVDVTNRSDRDIVFNKVQMISNNAGKPDTTFRDKRGVGSGPEFEVRVAGDGITDFDVDNTGAGDVVFTDTISNVLAIYDIRNTGGDIRTRGSDVALVTGDAGSMRAHMEDGEDPYAVNLRAPEGRIGEADDPFDLRLIRGKDFKDGRISEFPVAVKAQAQGDIDLRAELVNTSFLTAPDADVSGLKVDGMHFVLGAESGDVDLTAAEGVLQLYKTVEQTDEDGDPIGAEVKEVTRPVDAELTLIDTDVGGDLSVTMRGDSTQGIVQVDDVRADGTVAIDAPGGVVEAVAMAGGDDTAVPAYDLLAKRGSDSGADITGRDIVLDAGAGRIGASDNPVETDLQGGTADLRGESGIDLAELAGDLRLVRAVSAAGDVDLSATGAILDTDAPDADGAKVRAGALTLRAGGDIGRGANRLQIDTRAALDANTTSGGMVLTEVAGDLRIDRATAETGVDVLVEAGSALTDRAVARAGDLDLVAAGAVRERAPDGDVDLGGRVVTLDAQDGAIGAADEALELDTGAGTLGKLVATATAGIHLAEQSNGLRVSRATTGGGAIRLSTRETDASDESLTVLDGQEVRAAGGPVTLRAADDLRVGADAQVVADDRLVLRADADDADAAGARVQIAGTATGASVDLATSGDADRIEIGSDGRLAADGGDLDAVLAGGNDTLNVAGELTATQALAVATGPGDDSLGVSGLVRGQDGVGLTTGAGADGLEVPGRIAGGPIDTEMGAGKDTIEAAGTLTGSTLDVATASGADSLTFTGALRFADIDMTTGAGPDEVRLALDDLVGDTTVLGGGADDLFDIDRLPTLTTTHDGQRDALTLDGAGGTDLYDIQLAGDNDYVINVRDTGAPNNGIDEMILTGTSDPDTVLVRQNLIALLHESADGGIRDGYERINYDANLNARVRIDTQEGADSVTTDANAAALTIDLGRGADSLQVGQLFKTPRDTDAGLAPGDTFETIETRRGFLSKGLTQPAVVYGGRGNDSMTVYSNKAEIRLEGERGDDTFLIRAFALADDDKLSPQEKAQLKAGTGNDQVRYNVNAPVDIDGGRGFDKVVALGTPLDDNFVVTADGIFGAGLNINFENVEEAVELDALEGDDDIYVLSTAADTVTRVIGGLGDDEVRVTGDVTQRVVSGEPGSRSGIVNHGISSDDPAYAAAFVPGISLRIQGGEDEGAITQSDNRTLVAEDRAGAIDTYTIRMPGSAPTDGTTAHVTVSAALASSQLREKNGRTVLVSTDGETFKRAAVLTFDADTWTSGQTVYVKAASDDAREGTATAVVSHTVVSSDPEIDGLRLPSVDVTVRDDDKPDVRLKETGTGTTVTEGRGEDTYTVQLTRAPAAGETVTVNLATADDELSLSTDSLTFDANNWDEARTVTVEALDDGEVENPERIDITHSVSSTGDLFTGVRPRALAVDVNDTNSARVIVTESDGATRLVDGGPGDTYTLTLSREPTASVTIDIKPGPQVQADSDDPRFQDKDDKVVFGPDNWADPVEITLTADPDADPQPSAVLTVAKQPHRLDRLNGPLLLDGGASDRSLNAPVTLPGESGEAVAGDGPTGDDSDSTDRVTFHNDTSVADQSGTLTAGRLTGFGTSGPVTFTDSEGKTRAFDGGVGYTDFEIVEALLGRGDETLDVDSTASGALTVIHGGGGSDRIDIDARGGPLVVFGDTASDGVRYSASSAEPDGNAFAFSNPGDDIIDASDAAKTVIIHGGPGQDTIDGSQAGDHLLGGLGRDTIRGHAGRDHIYGDSGLNLDPVARTTEIVTGLPGAGDTLSAGQGRDIVLGDHGVVTQATGQLRVRGTCAVQAVATAAPTRGGDDAITLGTGGDIAFAGTGGDVVEAGAGADRVGGDHGRATLGAGRVAIFRTTDVDTPGGADRLLGGSAADWLVGGTDADILSAASGDDLLFGDNGRIEAAAGAATLARATQSVRRATGDDRLEAGAGADLAIAGLGADDVSTGPGADVAIGDAGRIVLDAAGDGGVTDVATLRPERGGADTIATGADGDLAFGGGAGDMIRTGPGDDRAVGDHAAAEFTDGALDVLETVDAGVGVGADEIAGAAGDDWLIGAGAGDTVTAGHGRDVVLGDNGRIGARDGAPTLVRSTASIAAATGADLLATGAGADLAIAGIGADDVSTGTGADVAIGDAGRIVLDDAGRGLPVSATTQTTAKGGADEIATGAGPDVVLAGSAGDRVQSGQAGDIVLGDQGTVQWTSTEAGAAVARVTTDTPLAGGDDRLVTGAGADIVLGGSRADTLVTGAGADLAFGDHGRVVPSGDGALRYDQLPLSDAAAVPFNFTAIDTAADKAGGADRIESGAGADIVLGSQAGDRIEAGAGPDDVIGGHNVVGGADAADAIDAGRGADVVAGDNARITRTDDAVDPRFRALAGSTLWVRADDGDFAEGYTVADTGTFMADPDGDAGRAIVLLDHTGITPDARYGADLIAGGGQDDRLFGQLGADRVLGDGEVIDRADGPAAVTVTDAGGDDYIEGGGHGDTVLAGLGQDDVIGGSSDLFLRATPSTAGGEQLVDGADTLYGGRKDAVGRNDRGDRSAGGHARDADVLLGDNGRILRLLDSGGAPLTFTYDSYGDAGTERIAVRGFETLAYTPGTGADSDIGAADEIHGEAGDDIIHGMTGGDVIYAEGQNDDVYGGVGDDWISGGPGIDGVLGDDGKILTSRNGSSEPLYGLDSANAERTVTTNANAFTAALYPAGELNKRADLSPFGAGGDDLIYGGLGQDFLHGGAGQDGISGAEALPFAYATPSDWRPTIGDDGRLETPLDNFYDANNALQRIDGFVLNFDHTEGETTSTDGDPAAGDGADRIFGDTGDDWIVGGTGRDHMYAGRGGDIVIADDDLSTNGGRNDAPDAADSGQPVRYKYADLVYGGAGRDLMTANTSYDRLVDWAGEYNNYVVPFGPFGNWTVVRSPAPWIQDFLLDVSEADGADLTRVGGDLGTEARNGEPHGELGMVTQEDPEWTEQTGAPDGKQPGNTGGTQRDGRGIEPTGGATTGQTTAQAQNSQTTQSPQTTQRTGTADSTGGADQPTKQTQSVDASRHGRSAGGGEAKANAVRDGGDQRAGAPADASKSDAGRHGNPDSDVMVFDPASGELTPSAGDRPAEPTEKPKVIAGPPPHAQAGENARKASGAKPKIAWDGGNRGRGAPPRR